MEGGPLLHGEALLAKPFSAEGLRDAVSLLLSGAPGAENPPKTPPD